MKNIMVVDFKVGKGKTNSIIDGGGNKYYVNKNSKVVLEKGKMYDVETSSWEYEGKTLTGITKATETKSQIPQEPIKEIKPPDWEGKERRGIRAMLTSYAKDLVIAEKMDFINIENWVEEMCDNVYEKSKEKK